MEKTFKAIKRVIIDLLIIIAALSLFATLGYQHLPPALQLISLKMLIVSVSTLVAHFIGKSIFGEVPWDMPMRSMSTAHLGRLVFYAIIPIVYALCG